MKSRVKMTKNRDEYEYELRMDIIGKMIKQARQDRNLSQEQLGESEFKSHKFQNLKAVQTVQP
jgi:ribosome-binding protein aMBF1 (putative translation factor)